jgi:hypothetical protein
MYSTYLPSRSRVLRLLVLVSVVVVLSRHLSTNHHHHDHSHLLRVGALDSIWMMRFQVISRLNSLATCIRLGQSVYDSEVPVLSISQLRLWDICANTLAAAAEKGESISVAGACHWGPAICHGHVTSELLGTNRLPARGSSAVWVVLSLKLLSGRNVSPSLLILVVVVRLIDRFGKFDRALFHRLVQSSQLPVAHPRGPLRYLWLALL